MSSKAYPIVNGYWLGGEIDIDEAGRIPPGCTTIAPPDLGAGEWAAWASQGWVVTTVPPHSPADPSPPAEMVAILHDPVTVHSEPAAP